jgi:hypothetical protein
MFTPTTLEETHAYHARKTHNFAVARVVVCMMAGPSSCPCDGTRTIPLNHCIAVMHERAKMDKEKQKERVAGKCDRQLESVLKEAHIYHARI